MSVHAAVEAARAAGAILRDAGRPAEVTHKGRVDLVTEIDVACEAAIRQVLDRFAPGIPVLGEEGGGAEGAGTRWVVDPLDGTTNFVHGFPYFGPSIALEHNGESVIGVVYDVSRDRLYVAESGSGAFCNGAPIAVSQVDTVEHALIGTGFPYDRAERPRFYLDRVEAVMVRAQGIRRAGAAALDLAAVAAGELDGFWEFGLKPWDVAAGAVLIREAGGQITAHDGTTMDRQPVEPLATNGRIHDALRDILAL